MPLADGAYSIQSNAFAHAALAALDSGGLRIQCLSCGRAATDGDCDCDCDSSDDSDVDDVRAPCAAFRLITIAPEAQKSSSPPPQPQRVRIAHADLGMCLGVSECRRRAELQPVDLADEGYTIPP
jgi:hypothetical protein